MSGDDGEYGGDYGGEIPEEIADEDEGWSYANPKKWGTWFEQCGGSYQSPIDFDASTILAGAKHHGMMSADVTAISSNIRNSIKSTPLRGVKLGNNGLGLQVNGSFGSFFEYEVKNFNFHSPSEHKIQGVQYDAEMQIMMSSKTGDLAGFSILFQINSTAETAEPNEFLSSLGWADAPEADEEAHSIPGEIDLFGPFFESIEGMYYNYAGSLTRPPCTEDVMWVVFTTPACISKEQVATIKALFPDPMNNRPVQPVNGRKVRLGDMGTDASKMMMMLKR